MVHCVFITPVPEDGDWRNMDLYLLLLLGKIRPGSLL